MSYSRDIFNKAPQADRRRAEGYLATKKGESLKGKRFSKYVSRLMKRRIYLTSSLCLATRFLYISK